MILNPNFNCMVIREDKKETLIYTLEKEIETRLFFFLRNQTNSAWKFIHKERNKNVNEHQS